MALAPHLAFTSLGQGPHTVEFWLDFTCPFSARATGTLERYLVPKVLPGGDWYGKVRLLIRPFPQPWHPQGGWIAESALAFGRAYSLTGSPEDASLWFKFFAELMRQQDAFKDGQISELTVKEIKGKITDIGGELYAKEKGGSPSDAADRLVKELFSDSPRGSAAIPDVKYFVRLGRQNGIHVTLSVVVNGIFDGAPQSGWSPDEWDAWFAKQGITA